MAFLIQLLRPRLRTVAFVAIGVAIWLPCLHLLFPTDAARVIHEPTATPRAVELAAGVARLWAAEQQPDSPLARMQAANPEWDLMARTYAVLGLANLALRSPAEAPRAIREIEAHTDRVLRLEAEHGFTHFLLPYARRRPFLDTPARSLFVDSQIAVVLGVDLMLAGDHPEHRAALEARVATIVERMQRAPLLSAESYPDECWTFDQVHALVALRLADAVLGTHHEALVQAWLQVAKARLVDARTGLLVSEFKRNGEHLDGPEGSSIWMVAHMLQLLDEPFARDQYDRARQQLRQDFLGFSVAREWPVDGRNSLDVDSGLVVPFIDASPGSSGMALAASSAFGDTELYAGLLRSLDLAAFPVRTSGGLTYAASNPVGDAVNFYASVVGPLWPEVRRRWQH